MDKITTNAQSLYDHYRVGHYSYGDKREKYDPFLIEFLKNIPRNKKLYDVGCGSGFWLESYVHHGVSKNDITGVDLSSENIAEIQNKGFNAQVGNVLNLEEVKNDVADYTISNGVIHHTSDPLKAFQEIVRITKPQGKIFLTVYNKWNPYYYIVHKATFPIRYYYWEHSKKIFNVVYPIAKCIMQPFAKLFFGEFLDDKTARTIFMDQVMTPRADLFSKKILRRYAGHCNCRIKEIRYIKRHLMLAAVFEVN